MKIDFENLLLETDNSINNVLENQIIVENYFNSTLEFITESTKVYNSNIKALYKNILESNNCYDNIKKCFNIFFNGIKDLIDKFIEFICSLKDKFITYLYSVIESDKYLLKHEKDLLKFDFSNNFTFKGYDYTFNPNIPVIKVIDNYNRDFIDLNFVEFKNESELLNYVEDKYSSIVSHFTDRYDLYRGQVLNRFEDRISEINFTNELIKEFRNGKYEPQDLTINNSYIVKAIDRIKNYKTIKDNIKTTNDNIVKEYNIIKNNIKNINNKSVNSKFNNGVFSINLNKDGSNSINVSSELYSKINIILKAKFDEVISLSNIHALSFSYKLEALKESFIQDKTVLYSALNMVEKEGL